MTTYAALPLRLLVGYGFLAHGFGKLHRGPAAFSAILSLVSIPSSLVLAVAILTVHLPYGFNTIKLLSVSNGGAQFGPPGYECDLLYIASLVALSLSGPTPWSVDNYRRGQDRTGRPRP